LQTRRGSNSRAAPAESCGSNNEASKQHKQTRRHQQDKAAPAEEHLLSKAAPAKQGTRTSISNQRQPTTGWEKTLRVRGKLNAREGKPTVAVADQNTPRNLS